MEGDRRRGDEGMVEQLVCRQAEEFVGMQTLLQEVSKVIREVIGDGGGLGYF